VYDKKLRKGLIVSTLWCVIELASIRLNYFEHAHNCLQPEYKSCLFAYDKFIVRDERVASNQIIHKCKHNIIGKYAK